MGGQFVIISFINNIKLSKMTKKPSIMCVGRGREVRHVGQGQSKKCIIIYLLFSIIAGPSENARLSQVLHMNLTLCNSYSLINRHTELGS